MATQKLYSTKELDEGWYYYAVYLSGGELPVAVLADFELAERFCERSDMSLDKEIRLVDFYKFVGPVFRDKTQPVKQIKATQFLIKPLES